MVSMIWTTTVGETNLLQRFATRTLQRRQAPGSFRRDCACVHVCACVTLQLSRV